MGRILSKNFIEADAAGPKCGQLGMPVEEGFEEPKISEQANKFYFQYRLDMLQRS